MRRPRTVLLGAASLSILGLLLARAALADSPTRGQLFAAGDHVLPGESLTVTGSQLDAGETLTFRLSIKSTDLDLGTAVVAADGSVAISALIPIGTPVGYAEVSATNASGSTWTTITLIGERAEGPGSSTAPTPAATDGPVDDQVIGLLMAGFGVVLLVVAAAWWWTGRRRK